MLAVLKRVGLETLLFVLSAGVGFFVYVVLASHNNNETDRYWTAHGFPPPGDYAFSPGPYRWLFLFGPWVLLISARVLRWALPRVRPRHLSAR